jgi:hypothetical protein
MGTPLVVPSDPSPHGADDPPPVVVPVPMLERASPEGQRGQQGVLRPEGDAGGDSLGPGEAARQRPQAPGGAREVLIRQLASCYVTSRSPGSAAASRRGPEMKCVPRLSPMLCDPGRGHARPGRPRRSGSRRRACRAGKPALLPGATPHPPLPSDAWVCEVSAIASALTRPSPRSQRWRAPRSGSAARLMIGPGAFQDVSSAVRLGVCAASQVSPQSLPAGWPHSRVAVGCDHSVLPIGRPRDAITATSSAASIGFGTCAWKPAERSRTLSSRLA